MPHIAALETIRRQRQEQAAAHKASLPARLRELVRAATAYQDCALSRPDVTSTEYALLTLMRAINNIDALHTDDMHETIGDVAYGFGEDEDGNIDAAAVQGARDRGYPGNVYMRDAMQECGR